MPTGIYERTQKEKERLRKMVLGIQVRFEKGCKKSENAYKFPKDSENLNWKGDKVGYQNLHIWIRKTLGKPQICQCCGATWKEKRLEWANKSGLYKRDLKDWISLCRFCHKKYDKEKIED